MQMQYDPVLLHSQAIKFERDQLMETPLQLPSYRDQSASVSARFEKLHRRPVKLKVEDLSKKFNTPKGEIAALNKINFQIHRREFITVIGPSGCGKTTLIRILAGPAAPTSGTATVGLSPAPIAWVRLAPGRTGLWLDSAWSWRHPRASGRGSEERASELDHRVHWISYAACCLKKKKKMESG